MDFSEKVAATAPEFLKAFRENNEQELKAFMQEFDNNPALGIKVCIHCIYQLLNQENEDDKKVIDDLKPLKQRLRIRKKLGFRALYDEADETLNLDALKEKIGSRIDGMIGALHISTGWIYGLSEAFRNGEIDSSGPVMGRVMRQVMKTKFRHNFLRTMLNQYRDNINTSWSIADINRATSKLIDSYVNDHPFDLDPMRFNKRPDNNTEE